MGKARLKEKLKKGIDRLRLAVPEDIQQILLDFLILLRKWNQTYNLTAIADIEDMVSYHILDSLSIIPYFKGKIILDVGSGAGFPGIPLALIFPDKQFILLDSSRKKFAFLLQAVSQFKIPNVVIVRARVSGYQREFSFDTITCRAFGSLKFIIDQTQHLLCPLGRWFVMKGIYPKEELGIILQSSIVHRLIVPGLHVERHLVEIENKCCSL